MTRKALLLVLLLIPAFSLPASADAPQTTSTTKCLQDVDLLLCVTATLTLQLTCTRVDAGHVACDAPTLWTTEGHSTAFVPGGVQHAASSNLEWCRPGMGCQSYGVGFRIDGCSWVLPANSCASSGPYNLYPGPIPFAQGSGCMDLTLSGFAEADGFLGGYFGHSVISAVTTNEVHTTFCD